MLVFILQLLNVTLWNCKPDLMSSIIVCFLHGVFYDNNRNTEVFLFFGRSEPRKSSFTTVETKEEYFSNFISRVVMICPMLLFVLFVLFCFSETGFLSVVLAVLELNL